MIHQTEVVGIKQLSRAVITTLIATILAIVVFASTAFAGLITDYNVDIIDDGVKTTITTNETEPTEILNKANVFLLQNDKLDISSFTSGEGGQIVIDRQKTVNIELNGAITTYTVYSDTVSQALIEVGVGVTDNDSINFALTDSVSNGMLIHIKSAFEVTVNFDGATANYPVVDGTVADILSVAGITLLGEDYVEPSLETTLSDNMTVSVFRVTHETKTVTEDIDYKTTNKKDSSMNKGKSKTEVKGVRGEASVTYDITYINGKESNKTELTKIVTKEAVDEVKIVGTKEVKAKTASASVKSNGVKSKNGYSVGQVISGKYTHYCACATCNGNSRGITASGKKISNGMTNPYYIACNWLPLGSVINVDGTSYTVVDRGGSSLSRKGRIDIFTPEGHSACKKKGTGKCTITIERLGW